MPIELKTKQGNITLTAPKTSGGTVDLSNYYTKAQTDEKIEEAVANIDIPEVDLTGYAKIEDIPSTVITNVKYTYAHGAASSATVSSVKNEINRKLKKEVQYIFFSNK